MKLIEISESGHLSVQILLDDQLRSIVEAMAGVYHKTGFVRPWVGYVAAIESVPLGVCGFKSPHVAGRVEIAYGTLAGHEGRGIATAMARARVTGFIVSGNERFVGRRTARLLSTRF